VYSILLSLLLGIVVGVVYSLLGWWKTWAMGIILGVLVAVGGFVALSRWMAKRFEPRFLHVQKQIQAGASQAALKSLEALLPLTRWQILLKGQLYAQMGLLCYAMERDDHALTYLEKSSLRSPDARLALAALHFRRKRFDEAKEVMEFAIKANKKQALLYNVQAWMLAKRGERDAAIEVLQRYLKLESSNESSKDNLLRLQNERKMNMKRFGVQWYGLRLEKPPAALRAGHPPGVRKGFRTKQKKQKRR